MNGIEGARAFQMPPNSVFPLFDANCDVMYIKITDGAGFPTIRTFDFSERVAHQATATPVDDRLDKIMNMLNNITEVLNNGKQPVRKQSKPAADE